MTVAADPRARRLEVAALADSLVPDRVIVFGSLPGKGRDLDLLARPREEAALREGLSSAGFGWSGVNGVRFADATVDQVDLVPAADWRLDDAALEELFDQAVPLDGYGHLARPSAHHALLVLALRVVRGTTRLDRKRRRYVDRALAEDADAWASARVAAAGWGLSAALRALERAYVDDEPVSRAERLEAMRERHARSGGSPAGAAAALLRMAMPRRRLGRVVTLSGIDGSGKSTQARLLEESLVLLGHDARVEWNKLGGDGSWVWRFRDVAAGAVVALRGKPPAPETIVGRRGEVEADAAMSIRRNSPALTQAWAGVLAFANGLSNLSAVGRHLLHGRVVICDRWVLDSFVNLRLTYGDDNRWTVQRGLVRTLSPPALRSFFLDLPADEAWERKREDRVEWLRDLAERYREEAPALGVQVVDATQPVDEVAATIGGEVWRALRER